MKESFGQTIIEVVIALSAALLIIGAVTVLVVTSVNNSSFIKNQNISAKWAQQGMEYTKFLRNSNLSQFKSYSGTYCMGEGNNITLGPCVVNIGGSYIREIEFEPNSFHCGNTETKVRATVSWPSGKCKGADRFCHKSELVSCFSPGGSSPPPL